MNFTEINNQIIPANKDRIEASKNKWDSVAKPLGSLGLLEGTVTKIAGITNDDINIDKRAVLVLCADNGVTEEKVAATPPEVTFVMADIIAQKKSAVCLMAKTAGADSIAVDMGMFKKLDSPDILDRRIKAGTANMTKGPAMSRDDAIKAIETGIKLAETCKNQGYKILATGEMGIGNTTTSSAMASVFLEKSVDDITGRGVGLTDEGLSHKINTIKKSIEVNKPDKNDPLDILQKLGGFDIAGMCGIFIGGALNGIPIIVDGVISSVAALTAKRLCPKVIDYMLASHMSKEPAAPFIMDELGLNPPVHGEMRLGEGTGAVTLLPLIDMALSVYNHTATYSDIGM